MNLFILRRDLRIEDNTALIEALKNKEPVALVFIFNTTLDKTYFCEKGNDFLKKRLDILSEEVPINFYESDGDIKVLKKIIKNQKVKRIYFNSDITSFAVKRDKDIKKLCKDENIECHSYNDYLLFNPAKTLNKSGKPFRTFKSFWDFNYPKLKLVHSNKYKIDKSQFISFNNKWTPEKGDNYSLPITRKHVFKEINRVLSENFKKNRDFLKYENTKISAALKFGVVSYREIIEYVLSTDFDKYPFIRQLLWKEFYYHFYIHHRSWYIIRGKNPSNIDPKFDKWKWSNDKERITRWKEGKTGIPVIDAAMHELNETGYMHNRARMIVASFLCKNLNLDWRIGEKYFATKLIDYDPIVNNQSWQWASFTGLDYRGLYRVFSPQIQAKKFDKDNFYIDKYNSKNRASVSAYDAGKLRKEYLERMKSFLDKYKK